MRISEIPRNAQKSRGLALSLAAWFAASLLHGALAADEVPAVSGAAQFRDKIQPVLKEFCFDCHGDGANKGNVAFDSFSNDAALLDDHDLWLKALKNLRAGLMPPPKKPQPSLDQ